MVSVLQLLYLAAVLLFVNGALAATGNSAGCGKNPTLTSGTRSTTVNGKNRRYILRVPNNYNPNNPYKLIFGLHWYGATMTEVATGQSIQRDYYSYYGLQRLANETAIFVAPQGIDNGFANTGGEDVDFIDNIISTVNAGLCVDQGKIFSTGFSYGAAMSYALACARPNTFRAVAVLSGGPVSGCAGGNLPVAYLGIHGIRDTTAVPDSGSQVRDTFVKANGCQQTTPRKPTQGSLTHVKTQYTGCSSDHPVTWIWFDDGHLPAPYDGGTGNNAMKAFSPGETWAFFTQFDGISSPTTTSQPAGGTPTVSTSNAPTSTGGSGCSVSLYGQCGGNGYSGCTKCTPGSVCKAQNDWYSQCL